MWRLIQTAIVAVFVGIGAWDAQQLDPDGESTKRGAIVIWSAMGFLAAFVVTFVASRVIDYSSRAKAVALESRRKEVARWD